ncbi:Ig-like domain-containing protein [Deinococcus yavapaiensis]|uniref:Ig-like protein group 3 n=1 Tax=Deinococcus yavapaiensis KR-236 TaxID=694435 RepID=A0A318S639_9DEIO|nr:Ig-like domain-containing protein [Deinococcus yavapaiensis]PYE53170.1 hypothetical protein DES52_110154 [Deinococcus yavapaiensis KR-236]
MKKAFALTTITLALVACNTAAPVPDQIAPSANITLNPTTVTTPGPITLTSNPTDNIGVTRVEFYKNDILIGADTSAPYSTTDTITAGTPNGTIRYNTRAYDAAGNVGTSDNAVLTVNFPSDPLPGRDITPPTVELFAPAPTITNAGTYALTAQATDNVGVTSVAFYRGATLISTDTTSPYTATFTTTSAQNGTLSFTAVAKDAAGNTTTSSAVNVTVDITPDTTPPVVTIAAPASITTAGEYKVSATATDANGIDRVEFYENGQLVTTDTTAPYESTRAATSGTVATRVYRAVAFDTEGNQAQATANTNIDVPSSFNQEQTRRLIGTWVFTYNIGSTTFQQTYRLDDVRENSFDDTVYDIYGRDQLGNVIVAGYVPSLSKFTLLDEDSTFDRFFIFDFAAASNTSVSGCYYQNANGTQSDCYAMTGTKTSSDTTAALTPHFTSTERDVARHEVTTGEERAARDAHRGMRAALATHP